MGNGGTTRKPSYRGCIMRNIIHNEVAAGGRKAKARLQSNVILLLSNQTLATNSKKLLSLNQHFEQKRLFKDMQTLPLRDKFSFPSTVKQKTDDFESVQLLLRLSHNRLPEKCEQGQYKELKTDWKLQKWKVCDAETAHFFHLMQQDITSLKRQLLGRLKNIPGHLMTDNTIQSQRNCNSNWVCCKVASKKKHEKRPQKHEKRGNQYSYDSKCYNSTGDHIERYRKEVTFKIMEGKTPFVKSDRQIRYSSKDPYSIQCYSIVSTRVHETEKGHGKVTIPSTACDKTDLQHCNAAQGENSLLKPPKLQKKHEHGAKSRVNMKEANARAYSIRSITVPSIRFRTVKRNPLECMRSWECDGIKSKAGIQDPQQPPVKRTRSIKERCTKIMPKIDPKFNVQSRFHLWCNLKITNALRKKESSQEVNDIIASVMKSNNNE